ncbi:MAG: putative glycoside hydrolase, partial [Halobacteriales archaeon]|nr:putative glycoside hydrolase [Halobacteriales archaeon]
VDEAPTAPVQLLAVHEVPAGPVETRIDVSETLAEQPLGAWVTVAVPLACLRDAGFDPGRALVPWGLETSGSMRAAFSDIRLDSETGSVVPCA